jgi:hypothetical protein
VRYYRFWGCLDELKWFRLAQNQPRSSQGLLACTFYQNEGAALRIWEFANLQSNYDLRFLSNIQRASI